MRSPIRSRPDPPVPMIRRLGLVWMHRFNESGRPAQHKLFDHIWLSGPLADRQDGTWNVRRRTHGGQGSDHDPAIAQLGI
jgi:hypothetical protein